MKRLAVILALLLLLSACSTRTEYVIETTIVVSTRVYSSGSNPTPIAPQPAKLFVGSDSFVASGVGKGISDTFNLPEGVYKLTLTTDKSYTFVSVDSVSGSCTGSASTDKIASEVTVTGEVSSRGCRAIFNADPANGAWRVVLTRLQ
jgi:hypothetical protein